MKITFSKNSWEDYLSWQKDDKKVLKRITFGKIYNLKWSNLTTLEYFDYEQSK